MRAISHESVRRAAAAAILVAAAAVPAAASDASFPLARARRVIDAAVAEAHRLGAPGAAVAVVDAGGFPVAVERLDGTFVAGSTVSIGKARTAAIFGRPTQVLENAINSGRNAMLALTTTVGATPMQGGVPLLVDGRLIGAVGVSGAASADQDTAIAETAAKAIADPAPTTPATLVHVEARDAGAAFAAGKPLVETAGYKVHASRREKAGEAEVHLLDTDVFHVLEGEAVLVLGGELVEPRSTTPTELRGTSIRGGAVHTLKKGDVLVVPAGTPHWFREVVEGPVLYFAVKATGAAR